MIKPTHFYSVHMSANEILSIIMSGLHKKTLIKKLMWAPNIIMHL